MIVTKRFCCRSTHGSRCAISSPPCPHSHRWSALISYRRHHLEVTEVELPLPAEWISFYLFPRPEDRKKGLSYHHKAHRVIDQFRVQICGQGYSIAREGPFQDPGLEMSHASVDVPLPMVGALIVARNTRCRVAQMCRGSWPLPEFAGARGCWVWRWAQSGALCRQVWEVELSFEKLWQVVTQFFALPGVESQSSGYLLEWV